MPTYSFKTKDDFRVDVDASTPRSAYNKLMSIPLIRNMGITKQYLKYDKHGFAVLSFLRLEDK
tara:strand:+ start:108 stop:296 length:189 start_codon:yes stop_codon:yes gene_type:complete